MILRNRSRYPDSTVRSLVKFATSEVDMRRVCVNVRNTEKGWAGMAYQGVPCISNAPPSAEYLITMRIGKPEFFPMRREHVRRGEPEVVFSDWREATVFLAAHEAKHIEQYRENKPRSEVACNNFAAYMLRRYRERLAPATTL